MKALLRVALTQSQLQSMTNTMVFHLREMPPCDVVVQGVKYDLQDLLKTRLGVESVELMIVNTNIVEGVIKP